MKLVPLLYDTDTEKTAFNDDKHNRMPIIQVLRSHQ